MEFHNKHEGTKPLETTTFKLTQTKPTSDKYKSKIAQITNLLNYFNKNYVFEDKLRFNFLLHLFSTKLQDLYANFDQISDREFNKRMNLLTQSLDEIQPYSI